MSQCAAQVLDFNCEGHSGYSRSALVLCCVCLSQGFADIAGSPSQALSKRQREEVTQIVKATKHDASSSIHSSLMATRELLCR